MNRYTKSKIVTTILKASREKHQHRLDDSIIMDAVVPQPEGRTPESEVKKIFVDGAATCPGAYKISELRESADYLPEWKNKLSDAYKRYVLEEFNMIRNSINNPIYKRHITQEKVGEASEFVKELLHLRLDDGDELRSRLSNLEESAASRNALKIFLKALSPIPEDVIDNPHQSFNKTLNHTVSSVWRDEYSNNTSKKDPDIGMLLKLNAKLNSLEFPIDGNNRSIPFEIKAKEFIKKQFRLCAKASFSKELGGVVFFNEFLRGWIHAKSPERKKMVYLCHGNGQLIISLKCIEAFLKHQPKLSVVLVPKNGHHGKEASWEDVKNVLQIDRNSSKPIFTLLHDYADSKRFIVCQDGPRMQGLHPERLSQELCYHLYNCNVIFAEGQSYAEIRGWYKPTYLLFQVKGRVAEAIHGVSRKSKPIALVRVGHGAVHFSHPQKSANNKRSFSLINTFEQTTSDYVKAVLSDNYNILCDKFFKRNDKKLFARLREESTKTNKRMADIILGTKVSPKKEVQNIRKSFPPDVFAIGGGGGFSQVTLKALKKLEVNVAAGVPSTDDGGSTGKLQIMLRKKFGYVFGVGDAAAIMEQQIENIAKWPVLSFRFPNKVSSVVNAIVKHMLSEVKNPSIEGEYLTECEDYMSFVCEQLNLARIIDEGFLKVPGFTVEGASVRNLNVIAAFYMCSNRDRRTKSRNSIKLIEQKNADQAWFLLEEAYGLNPHSRKSIRTIPVTYDQGILYATYSKKVSNKQKKRFKLNPPVLIDNDQTVYGQQYIDKIIPSGRIVDFGIRGAIKGTKNRIPRPNPEYLWALKSAKLIMVGAGSLFGSQLAQLAIPGVLNKLIEHEKARKILIVNHVCMNETMYFSLTDHVKAIEKLANRVVATRIKNKYGGSIKIGDIFTDVIVPRTVAQEIDASMRTELTTQHGCSMIEPDELQKGKKSTPLFVNPDGTQASSSKGIFKNRYVKYVLEHKKFREIQRITDWELRVLGYMEQPEALYRKRSEAGRYRGAVYAVQDDLDYLIAQGIPRRHIYEVESIGMIQKILKAKGKPEVEEFPGLIPESLVGIFKILLDKGVEAS